MLAETEILEAYAAVELTPSLVVLGGSRAFGYGLASSDHDYFGYHFETEPELIDILVNNVKIESKPHHSVMSLLSDPHPYRVVYNLTNWLWCEPIYQTTEAETLRTAIRSFFDADRDRFISRFEQLVDDLNNISVDHDGKFDKRFRKWRETVHIILVAHHLKTTGDLECSWKTLKSLYSVVLKDTFDRKFITE
jgi:hypothetical protein